MKVVILILVIAGCLFGIAWGLHPGIIGELRESLDLSDVILCSIILLIIIFGVK